MEALRNKLQAKLKKTIIVIIANGKALFTLKECVKSLKKHIKISNKVDYFVLFDLPMFEQLNNMGVEKEGIYYIEDIPITRVVTQCPIPFASRSTYWNIINLIPSFNDYDSGIMISSKIAIGKDITDDMINDGNSIVIKNNICITCNKNYTNGEYIRACTDDSTAFKYSEEDLPTYNNVLYGGNIVQCCNTIETMIEQDMQQNILLSNPLYYYCKYVWDNKPTIEYVENTDFINDIQINLDHYKEYIDKINKEMVDYDNAHPEKEVADKNPNNPAYENREPVSFKRINYPDNVAAMVINTPQEYNVLLMSKSQRQLIKFEEDKQATEDKQSVEDKQATEEHIEKSE